MNFRWYINVPDTAIFEDSEPKLLIQVQGNGNNRRVKVIKGKEKITMNDLRLFFANTSNVRFEAMPKIKPLD